MAPEAIVAWGLLALVASAPGAAAPPGGVTEEIRVDAADDVDPGPAGAKATGGATKGQGSDTDAGGAALGGADRAGAALGPAALPEPVLAPAEPVSSDTLGVETPITDPGGRALAHFYEKLRATERGEGKTHITVYGASHMAGDFMTRILRHRLQGQFGDAGPGFVVPARPWKDYNHRDVNLERSRGWESYWVSRSHNRDDGLYGLAGCSFASDSKRDFCRIATADESDFGRAADRAEVWFWRQKRGGDLYVKIDGHKERVKTRTSKGKEAGPAYATFELSDGPHEIEIRPKGNGEVLLFGVAMDRDKAGVVMDTMGINGARASTQLSWDPRLFAEHLTRRKPDLLVLAYGTNATGDADDPIEDYERRVDLVINRVRSLVPQTSCLLVGPSDRPVKVEVDDPESDDPDDTVRGFLPRPRQQLVIATQRKLAHRYGCGFWDWNAAMGGDLSMLTWVGSEPRLGARDYVHLTRKGYERIADLFWDALMAGYLADAGGAAAQPVRTAQP